MCYSHKHTYAQVRNKYQIKSIQIGLHKHCTVSVVHINISPGRELNLRPATMYPWQPRQISHLTFTKQQASPYIIKKNTKEIRIFTRGIVAWWNYVTYNTKLKNRESELWMSLRLSRITYLTLKNIFSKCSWINSTFWQYDFSMMTKSLICLA